MTWEQQDGIWAADWKTGDLTDLAKRYVDAIGIERIQNDARRLPPACKSTDDLAAVRKLYTLSKWGEQIEAVRQRVDAAPLKRAVSDLATRYPDTFPASASRSAIDEFEQDMKALMKAAERQEPAALSKLAELEGKYAALQRKILLKNPVLDFDEILFVKRRGSEGLTNNWQGNDRLQGRKFENEIARFKWQQTDAEEITVYRPEEPMYVGDVDLHFDATKLMFSTNGTVCECGIDGNGFRKVVTDVNSYDPCYLPNDRLLFISNSNYHAVPCVSGGDYVGNIHIADLDGSNIRRLCFDQDNNWYPVMLANGRVMYTRWEYTDSAHYFSRVLMHMNPDGTNQVEFYGSNSYWPNSIFYARPIPGSSTKFIAVISGHHGVPRMGELVLFDAARGRHEAQGAVQRIPGYGKPVEAVTADRLVDASWPKFLHPYPLDEKTFLVSCRLTPSHAWGIYLVDVFDNMVPLKSIPGWHCLEPQPLRPRKRPPVIPDQVRPEQKNATVYISDIYEGKGLRGVPRGTVKALRVYQYIYAYRHTGGHNVIGYEGPWDVPVFQDGSTVFNVPANTPVAIQPLDSDGKALALMRSWFVGMPGEFVSCIGCHADQNMVPPSRTTTASASGPAELTPWYGPTRGFSFVREVQPVLDKYCVGCHDGSKPDTPCFVDDGQYISFPTAQNKYSKPYLALAKYVRRNGPEGDYHPLTPLEFHADTSELVQILTKGHHGIQLDNEAWDRIITWIDQNVPFYGTWKEAAPKLKQEYVEARAESWKNYADVTCDIEEIVNPYTEKIAYVPPEMTKRPSAPPVVARGWPFDAERAHIMQGKDRTLSLTVGEGMDIGLVRIPSGTFVMGDASGAPDEAPETPVKIRKAFYMSTCEVTNRLYQLFDPAHDSGVYDRRWKDQTNRGYFVNQPEMPVIRVSWTDAMAFCKWLSARTGRNVSLPTEAQWEWACRAGSDTPMWYGTAATDFGTFANLADVTTKELVVTGINPRPVNNPHDLACYLPAVFSVDDNVLHLAAPATYTANPWGLYDMHGNVAEWTRSEYRPYPYSDRDGRNRTDETDVKRVVRGGSWHDRPKRASSSYRLAYPAWQQVFNVGFRIVVEN
jgi:formylglycine-generating enzyme required for sulfatase activity